MEAGRKTQCRLYSLRPIFRDHCGGTSNDVTSVPFGRDPLCTGSLCHGCFTFPCLVQGSHASWRSGWLILFREYSMFHWCDAVSIIGYTHTQKALLARSGNHHEDMRKSQQFSNDRPAKIAFNLHNIFRDLACEWKLFIKHPVSIPYIKHWILNLP